MEPTRGWLTRLKQWLRGNHKGEMDSQVVQNSLSLVNEDRNQADLSDETSARKLAIHEQALAQQEEQVEMLSLPIPESTDIPDAPQEDLIEISVAEIDETGLGSLRPSSMSWDEWVERQGSQTPPNQQEIDHER